MPSITLNELIKQLNQLRLKNKLKGDTFIYFSYHGNIHSVEDVSIEDTHDGSPYIALHELPISPAYRLYSQSRYGQAESGAMARQLARHEQERYMREEQARREETIAQVRMTEERVEMAYQQAMMEAQAPAIPRQSIFQRWNPFRGV